MEQFKAMVRDMEKTSRILEAASEHMKKLEKTVDYNAKRYKEVREILEATYERIKDDRILRMYFPEIMEHMGESLDNDEIRRKDNL